MKAFRCIRVLTSQALSLQFTFISSPESFSILLCLVWVLLTFIIKLLIWKVLMPHSPPGLLFFTFHKNIWDIFFNNICITSHNFILTVVFWPSTSSSLHFHNIQNLCSLYQSGGFKWFCLIQPRRQYVIYY